MTKKFKWGEKTNPTIIEKLPPHNMKIHDWVRENDPSTTESHSALKAALKAGECEADVFPNVSLQWIIEEDFYDTMNELQESERLYTERSEEEEANLHATIETACIAKDTRRYARGKRR